MGNSVQTFIAGLVAIGMVTAVLLRGSAAATVLKAGGGVLQGSLGTAISGKG